MGLSENKNSKDTIIKIESYVALVNVDESILKLNSLTKKYGYEILFVEIEKLEKEFLSLFSKITDFNVDTYVNTSSKNKKVSVLFFETLMNYEDLGFSIIVNNGLFLVKAIENVDMNIINNTMSLNNTILAMNDLGRFVTNIIQQLRLFKNGDICAPIHFQISLKERSLTFKKNKIYNNINNQTFCLLESDVKEFGGIYKPEFTINNLTEVALKNFNLSYEISDQNTKFITLMTALECLFNQGRDQITHTISRHLALITSNNEKEFQVNYKAIKNLYGIRSSITHGSSKSKNIEEAIIDLQNKVRCAINYCLALNLDKAQLFEKLNSMGYKTN